MLFVDRQHGIAWFSSHLTWIREAARIDNPEISTLFCDRPVRMAEQYDIHTPGKRLRIDSLQAERYAVVMTVCDKGTVIINVLLFLRRVV